MKLADFDYSLPEALIARYPPQQRRDSRLLYLDNGINDKQFIDLPQLLNPGDLVVFNDSRVIPARLSGHKTTGGRVEVLIERIIADDQAWAHIRASKAPKVAGKIILGTDEETTLSIQQRHCQVIGREDDLFQLQFTLPVTELLEQIGQLPIPPYLQRDTEEIDRERYQTVYARYDGSVAAPTAGLHFDDAMLTAIRNRGVECAFLTLHVGAGTFQPVRHDIQQHKMHSETITVSESLCQQIALTKQRGGRVIAIGTTTVRALETAKGQPFHGETDIFITPGYQFHTVDALLTNFHLPKSTLLMLVCAFGGYDRIIAAYHHAVDHHYRFYSYGDAMLILR